ncbi:MAG: hypothetical protein AAF483_09280 [Planctomycetota bacterium]
MASKEPLAESRFSGSSAYHFVIRQIEVIFRNRGPSLFEGLPMLSKNSLFRGIYSTEILAFLTVGQE